MQTVQYGQDRHGRICQRYTVFCRVFGGTVVWLLAADVKEG